MGVHYIFKLVFSFLLDKYPEVELLDHLVVLFFIFKYLFIYLGHAVRLVGS